MDVPQFRKTVGTELANDYIRQLHSGGPIRQEQDGLWVISGWTEARVVLSDHDTFSSSVMEDGYPMLTDDPPRHTVLRAVLQRVFVPSAVAALRPRVEAITARAVSAIEAGVEIDAVSALATPIPLAVMAELLGVDAMDCPRFPELAAALGASPGSGSSDERERARHELRGYFQHALADPDQGAGSDVVRAIAAAREEGVDVTDEEAVDLVMLLLVAGFETTANLLGSVLHRLSRQPELWERLRGAPDLGRNIVDETVRLDSPVAFVAREAVSDVTLAGRTIRQGDRVVVYLAAANRDPGRWRRSHSFDCTRHRQRHLGFGHGIHFCLGTRLARLEAGIALRALHERFHRIRPGATAPTRRAPGVLNGFRHLPLVFS